MKSKFYILALFLLIITGCVQMPTTESKTVDNRPQLTFTASNNNISNYTVVIDGLNNGSVKQYSTGENSLRVLSGTHIIEFYKDGNLISSQKIYVNNGVTKEIIVE